MQKKMKGFDIFDPIPEVLGYMLIIPALIGIYAFISSGEGKFHDTLIEIFYIIVFIYVLVFFVGIAYIVFWIIREVVDYIKEKM